jgi:cold shock CspA family protein
MKIEIGKEYVHLGHFVSVRAFNEAAGTAFVQSRTGEQAEVRISELKPKEPRDLEDDFKQRFPFS